MSEVSAPSSEFDGLDPNRPSRVDRGAVGAHRSERPPAHLVVAAGEEMGDVGMETFHPGAGSADAACRDRSGVISGHRGIALVGIPAVDVGDGGLADRVLSSAHTAGGLEPADRLHP
jgi:hypothetical protein